MDTEYKIRAEAPEDVKVISEVTVAAFATLEISNQIEHLIVEGLRAAGALTLSLVAELEGKVIGHIAFSPITLSDGTERWYGLGPVSVLPEHQRQGVGKALIREGLSRLEGLGANGCFLVGHPSYYGQFGFEAMQGLEFEGVPPEACFSLAFNGQTPRAKVLFHEAFLVDK